MKNKKKKKVYTSADILFFTDIQHGAKKKGVGVYISVSARGPHKMVSRAAVCPPLL